MNSQSIEFCGVLPAHEASTSNPDSILYDRFGNSYDLNDFDNSSGSQTICGYFELDFKGIDLNLRGTICGVFLDISDLIKKRSNIAPCGAEVIAGEYAAVNDYENALDVLETISFRRNLSPVQEADLENVIIIYSLLEEKSIASFSSQDRSVLRDIAYSNIGMSSGIARSVLSYFKEYIPLPYYLDQQIHFRSPENEQVDEKKKFASDIPALKIYPNPAGDYVTIEWDEKIFQPRHIHVLNMYGQKMAELDENLSPAFNLITSDWNNGVYLIMAQDSYGKIISGKLIKQSN